MTELQVQAAFKLATNDAVVLAHNLIADVKAAGPWEFDGNLAGWIESHVTSAPDQSEEVKILQGCINSMSDELKGAFADSLTNTVLS